MAFFSRLFWYTAASIGTELLQYYCRAGLLGSIGIVQAKLSTPNGEEGYNHTTPLLT
jgi:hypothetical protein